MSCLVEGCSNDPSSTVPFVQPTVATVCVTVTTGLLESDEVLSHSRVCGPSLRGLCDGAKLTICLSFALRFSVVLKWAVMMELPPGLNGRTSALGMWFSAVPETMVP